MHRFFAKRIGENKAVLDEDESRHALRVLRMSAGDACQAVVDGCLYAAVLCEETPETLLELGPLLPSPEPSVRVTLYQGLPKGDKMEYIIQKCTEAGIVRIVPVLFSRSIAKWEESDSRKKTPRWQRIAQEAAKQSGRCVVPEVESPVTVRELADRLREHDLSLLCWEEESGHGIRTALNGQKDIAIVIGPEGGISPDEMAALPGCPVSLGPRILRTETAGLAALISLLTLTNDME